jgi:citrate synthase
VDDVAAWWANSVSRIEPGVIELRGRPVAELIGAASLVEVIWLMVRGDLPDAWQARLLEAAMVAGVDHGPHAPSIAIARMAATCGVGLNTAIASAVNVLGDSHGGAGEQCVELLNEICDQVGQDDQDDIDAAALAVVARWREESPYVPGFGHRFHPFDPRRDPLIGLVEDAVRNQAVPGRHLRAALAIERNLRTRSGRPVPMNIDGVTAVVYAELGLPAPLARGLFVLSRSIGVLAHAWEESQSGRRNKGPIPPSILPPYIGP